MPRRKQEPQKVESVNKRAREDDDDVTAVMKESSDIIEEISNSDDGNDANKIKLSLPEEYGELLFTGGTNWSVNGRKNARKGDEKYDNIGKNLYKPHRYTPMCGVPVSRVIAGCAANHNILLTKEGKVHSWGRNECGQLGHGDRQRYDVPKPIEALKQYTIVNAACGKNHTLCLTDDGQVFSFGDNMLGQLGLGSLGNTAPSPSKLQYRGQPLVDVGCGGNFSVVLDCEGNVHSFGCPEYGQLGNNTDGKYLAKANKISFNNVKSPFRIPLWVEKLKGGQVVPINDVKVTSIACGLNHVVALDSKKRVFTWGFGGYGRLGHSEQKDEHMPRLVQLFDNPARGAVQVYAGTSYSLAINELGCTYFWGILGSATTRDTTMYPKPVSDLQGWKVRSIGCGGKHIAVAADDSIITWGIGTVNGELGLGESRKSSANPDIMKSAAGLHIYRISCGQTYTMMIARTDGEGDAAALDALPQIDPKPCP